jgi:hypothetical protein
MIGGLIGLLLSISYISSAWTGVDVSVVTVVLLTVLATLLGLKVAPRFVGVIAFSVFIASPLALLGAVFHGIVSFFSYGLIGVCAYLVQLIISIRRPNATRVDEKWWTISLAKTWQRGRNW